MGSPSDEARRGEQAEDRGKLDRALDRSRGRSGEGVAQRQAALGTTHSTWTYGTNEDFAAGFSARMSPEEFNEFVTDMAMLAGPFTIARAAKLASPIANTMYSRYTGKVVGIGEDVTKRAAQLAKNRAVGKAAEAQAAKDLVAEGNSILGSQVSVRTAEGRRVIDHLVQDANGTIRAVEVKAGGAVRNASQLAKDKALATQGGTLVGKNAPAALRGQNMVIETVERRY
ncbi:hypothetical protein EA26_01525 [Vibrio navarrensis]|uniref:Uncharacterized protein n=2 Tax=Vibrio navarrensis TaxID=29495 RepID=A0A099LQY6_9VIBR|nr:hypothetical protein EA26_01525 [Vibrio navarrensis]MBE4615435.1 hypothetical protein [Vibrio navarrensis]